MNAPRAPWHPVLLVIDEAHVFYPQAGGAEAAQAVIDVCMRGRKRVLCPVLATQRLSKLHKDAAAEMLNKLIERTGLDVDAKRAADELGMTSREAMEQLRGLPAGAFWAFGPALTSTVQRAEIGDVATTHPKAGHHLMQTPPAASKRVLASLAKLADLQRDAEEEARTIGDLQARNVELHRRAVAAVKRALAAGVPETEVVRRIDAAVADATKQATEAWNNSGNISSPEYDVALRKIVRIAGAAIGQSTAPFFQRQMTRQPAPRRGKRRALQYHQRRDSPAPEQRILDAIAWMNAIGVPQPEQTAVAFMAGYTIGGGAWNNPRGALRTKG